MVDENHVAFDELTLQKESIGSYAVSDLSVEIHDDQAGEDVLFPARLKQDRDMPELQEIQAIECELKELQTQHNKVLDAFERMEQDAHARHQVASNPEKQKRFEELKIFAQQTQEKIGILNHQKQLLLNTCMQHFMQYISLIPDNLIAYWRHDKGYLLIFLNGRPQYFNTDTNTVAFSELWKYGSLYSIRGMINDFHKKFYLEFIVIWQQKE